MQYRPEVDGLRALAVVPVVLFHAGLGVFSGGFVGVDVFFVISGYLITSIILAELAAGRFSIVTFYERRARRILPALFLVLAASVPLAWIWLTPAPLLEFAQGLASVGVFASNILFWRSSGYFDTAAELKPLLHTWSLAVEEQFYLFFPPLLWALWRLGHRALIALLAAGALASLALSEWAVAHKPDASFYLLPFRAWELAIGSVLALHLSRPDRAMPPPRWARALEATGLGLIVWGVFAYDHRTPFPGLSAMLPTIGTALVIRCSSPHTPVGRLLASRPLVGIGLISYSAYLWHQPVFAFARHRGWAEPGVAQMLMLALLSFVLAWFSWRWVERPFRTKDVISRRGIFAFAGAGTLVLIAAGLWGMREQGFPQRPGMAAFAAIEAQSGWETYPSCEGTTLPLGKGGINFCRVSRRGPADALLLGDSHAGDKFHGIEAAEGARRWMLVGQSSCPPTLGIELVGPQQKDCRNKSEQVIDWIVAQSAIRVVAVSSFGMYASTTSFAADHLKRHVGPERVSFSTMDGPPGSRAELLYRGLAATVARLLEAGKEVVVMVDVPELPFFPVDCLKGRPQCEQSRVAVMARQAEHRAMLHRMQQAMPGLRLYDPTALFCNDSTCGWRHGETVLYRDSHHLSRAGSELYGRAFLRWLDGPH